MESDPQKEPDLLTQQIEWATLIRDIFAAVARGEMPPVPKKPSTNESMDG